jgi:hypothetical protein
MSVSGDELREYYMALDELRHTAMIVRQKQAAVKSLAELYHVTPSRADYWRAGCPPPE